MKREPYRVGFSISLLFPPMLFFLEAWAMIQNAWDGSIAMALGMQMMRSPAWYCTIWYWPPQRPMKNRYFGECKHIPETETASRSGLATAVPGYMSWQRVNPSSLLSSDTKTILTFSDNLFQTCPKNHYCLMPDWELQGYLIHTKVCCFELLEAKPRRLISTFCLWIFC